MPGLRHQEEGEEEGGGVRNLEEEEPRVGRGAHHHVLDDRECPVGEEEDGRKPPGARSAEQEESAEGEHQELAERPNPHPPRRSEAEEDGSYEDTRAGWVEPRAPLRSQGVPQRDGGETQAPVRRIGAVGGRRTARKRPVTRAASGKRRRGKRTPWNVSVTIGDKGQGDQRSQAQAEKVVALVAPEDREEDPSQAHGREVA